VALTVKLLILLGLLSLDVLAHPTAKIERANGKMTRVENGLLTQWEMESIEPDVAQVKVYDREGHMLTQLKVLQPAVEAAAVGIYDVSVRPLSMIAVAAVFKSKTRHARPVASLLLFDFDGKLRSAFALPPSRAILRLAIDDNSHVWTLTNYADNEAPSTAPMVVEYNADGTIAKEMLPRSSFPFHATEIREDSPLSRAALGYDSGVTWFWLPGSWDLTTIRTADGSVSRTTLPPPALPAGEHKGNPVMVYRAAEGKMLTQHHGTQGPNLATYDYVWSSAASRWSRFRPGQCDGGQLLGASDHTLFYFMYPPGGPYNDAEICTTPAP
jgi:hypothetical protein